MFYITNNIYIQILYPFFDIYIKKELKVFKISGFYRIVNDNSIELIFFKLFILNLQISLND